MKVKLFMAAVFYNHESIPLEQRLPVENIQLKVGPEQESENHWVVSTHYRQSKDDYIRQVAFRFEEIDKVDEIQIENTDVTLDYDKDHNVWFQRALFKNSKKNNHYNYDLNKMVYGITHAGTVRYIVRANGKELNRLVIHFIPASLAIQDYEQMITDLYNIRESLVRDDKNPAQVALRKLEVYHTIEAQVKKLKKVIDVISSSPHKQLQMKSVKKRKNENDKFNLQAAIEEYISPGNSRYRHHILLETTIVYENMLIKQLLLDLERYIKLHQDDSRIKEINNEQNSLLNQIDPDLKNLIGSSIENLVDLEKMKNIQQEVRRKTEKYRVLENSIRRRIKASLDNTIYNHYDPELCYVEVSLSCRGIPENTLSDENYKYAQSENGINCFISYDNREPYFQVTGYRYQEGNYMKARRYLLSYFGNISLQSLHVPSHQLLYSALHNELLEQGNNVEVIIKGYVKPVKNGRTPVSSEHIYRPEFEVYRFDFKYITEIYINNKPVMNMIKDVDYFLNELLPLRLKTNLFDDVEKVEMQYAQITRLIELEEMKDKIKHQISQYDELGKTIKECLDVPFLKNIHLYERLQIRPTAIFLHDPLYKGAWQAINSIQKEVSAALLVNETEDLMRTAKVEQIYEVWTLYKILIVLTQQLGWALESKNIYEMLDDYLLRGRSLKDFSVKMTRGIWTIEIYYEPKIDILHEKKHYIQPDFVFRFLKEDIPIHLVILDAKYRDYQMQGEPQWVKDINEVAVEKYSKFIAKHSKWQLPIVHSGIIHNDYLFYASDDEQYHSYFPFYNEQLFNTELSLDRAHKYSSIYMLPFHTHVFKNWFRMIMEYHLKAYDECWSCSESKEVYMKPLFTKAGNIKIHFVCQACNEFWVKVHCREKRIHLIVKHMLNYHLQVEKNKKWFVVCPCCGDGRKNKSVLHYYEE